MAGGKIRKARHQQQHLQGGIPFEKSKGQHILKNPMLVETIVQKSGIKPTDVVLEIGPDTGNLIKKLLEVSKSVVAIEVDPRMVLELNRRFQGTAYSNRLRGGGGEKNIRGWSDGNNDNNGDGGGKEKMGAIRGGMVFVGVGGEGTSGAIIRGGGSDRTIDCGEVGDGSGGN